LNQLVYCEVGSSVRTVLVDGRVIVRDGRLTTVDETALLAEADDIGRRVAAELDGSLSFVRRLQPYLRQAYLEICQADWPINRYASDAFRDLPRA
jgi:5-methylthioadenosine/S-adenosylhomocysteine deaminase